MTLTIDQAVPRFQTNETRFDTFVNGGVSATWTTSGGSVQPSITKFLADRANYVDSLAASTLSASTAAKNAAEAARDEAVEAAETATSAAALFDPDNYQLRDATLTSLAKLGTAAGKIAYTTGVDTWAEAGITAAGRALLDDTDAAAQRATLGLGTMALVNTAAVGVGATVLSDAISNANTITEGGIYRTTTSAIGIPYGGTKWAILHMPNNAGPYAGQLATSEADCRTFIRFDTGSWTEIARVSDVFGVGQTWQNVSASRAPDTGYQNTSGKSIMVSVRLNSVAGRDFQVSADGTSWLTVAMAGVVEAYVATIVVPNGYYYGVLGGYSAGTWMELR